MNVIGHGLRKEVVEFMNKMAAEGVVNHADMTRHVKHFLQSIFPEQLPPAIDHKYWPQPKDTFNCVYRCHVNERYKCSLKCI